MLTMIKGAAIKAFLVLYLSTGGYIEIEHDDGRTATSVEECKAQAAELYQLHFGTEQAATATIEYAARLMLDAGAPAEMVEETTILKIEGVCVDMDVRNGTGGLTMGEGAVTLAQAAPPRMPCHNAAEIARQLSQKYNEAPVAFGLQSNGNLLQVYACNKDCPGSGAPTWTVVSTTPHGLSCIVAAGRNWEQLPEVSDDPMA